MNPDILMCKYEDLVTSPMETMKRIYKELGRDFPGEVITAQVHARSVKKGKDVDLSPEVDRLAEDLQKELDEAYRVKVAQKL